MTSVRAHGSQRWLLVYKLMEAAEEMWSGFSTSLNDTSMEAPDYRSCDHQYGRREDRDSCFERRLHSDQPGMSDGEETLEKRYYPFGRPPRCKHLPGSFEMPFDVSLHIVNSCSVLL